MSDPPNAAVETGPAPGAPVAAWRAFLAREIGPVAAMLALAGGLLTFLAVADEMGEGDTRGFDTAILYALRQAGDPANPIGPKWLQTAAADVTALGSVTVLTLIVALVAGFFVASRRVREALLLVAAAASGALVSQGLKQLFGRERPPLNLHAVEVANPSFPSGHAMLSAVVYLTLAVLIARFAERRRVKAYALAAGVALTLLVGASRVFLGVHWPSDVLAGWSLGAAWALAWWLLALGLERWSGERVPRPSPSRRP